MNSNENIKNNNNPIVNDVEDIKTVTYFQNQPIQQQWFIVLNHGKIPMFNAPEKRLKRQAELKSIAKSVQMDNDRRKLMMKITNNDNNEQHSLELKFYSINNNNDNNNDESNKFEYSIDCRHIDIFRRSKKDRKYFYFTLESNFIVNNNCQQQQNDDDNIKQQQRIKYECYMYHAISISNADIIADIMEKQVQLNLSQKLININNNNVENKILKKKFIKNNSKIKNNDNNNNLPDIENVRSSCCCEKNNVKNPLDDKSIDDVIKSMHHVPSLLDLDSNDYNDNDDNNFDINLNNNDEFNIDYTELKFPSTSTSSTSTISNSNPFLSMMFNSTKTNNWYNDKNELTATSTTTTKTNFLNQNSQSTFDLPKLLSSTTTTTTKSNNDGTIKNMDHFRFDDEFDSFISKRIK